MKDIDEILSLVVRDIDEKRNYYEEEYKKTPQYKRQKQYKQRDNRHLLSMLDKRNTLVLVINYIRTGNEKYLRQIVEGDE